MPRLSLVVNKKLHTFLYFLIIKKPTISVERQGCNAGWIFVELTKSFLILCIPNVHQSIATPCSKSPKAGEECLKLNAMFRAYIQRMERNCINGPDCLYASLSCSMAFECVSFSLHFGRGIKVLDCHSALSRTQSITCLMHANSYTHMLGELRL